MNTKLDNITTQYRKFNENQALTDGQLNEFIDYFEDQDRLSRTRLSGVGVVCGFQSAYNDGILQPIELEMLNKRPVEIDLGLNTIAISQGVGVTTDGDLITLRRKITTSETSIDFDRNTYKYYRGYTDPVQYGHFMMGGSQVPLLELITADEYIPDSGFKLIKDLRSIRDKVIILYLESYSNDETPCEDADCDNTGAEQVSNLKVLLADSGIVSDLLKRGDAGDSLYTIHNAYEELFDQLPRIEAKRVILDPGIVKASDLRMKFQEAVSSVAELSKGFDAIAKTFKVNTYFDGLSLLDKLTSLIDKGIGNLDDYQYRYDLLKDLIDTYNEIKDLMLHLNAECCPDIGSFPKHLLLGRVGANMDLGEYIPYRHAFYHSPVTTNDDENYERVIMLANRFVQKINGFQSYIGAVKITPSNLYVRLGNKAIPYYYKVAQPLLSQWNYEKTKTDRQTYNLSYHTEALAGDDFIQNPLNYSIDNNDFYRIEGHLGMPYKTALQNINDLKAKYGLAFDTIALVLDKGGKPGGDTSPKKESVSIEDLRNQLASISGAISNQKNDSQSTLLNISKLDEKLRLLNKAEFSKEGEGTTVVRQDPKKEDVVSELLSEFLERKSGLEHVAGVEPGGTFILIYASERENQVLADFSLPYLCCSKKDPVFLSLPQSQLCQKDRQIPMTVVPSNGEVKAFVGTVQIPVIVQNAGQSYFEPSLVNSAYLGQTITFTVNDDPVEVKMVVYPQPSITLTMESPVYDYTNNQAVVKFKVTNNGSGSLSAYQWNFGDQSTADTVPDSSGTVSHLYKIVPNENSTYNAVLNVVSKDTGCSTQAVIAVELSGLQSVPCSDNFNYNGKAGTFEYNIDFGTDIGEAGINYDAISVPDRFVIEWGTVKLDSGFVGSSSSNGSLIAMGVNPADIRTANPSNGAGKLTFMKNTPFPRYAKVTVYAPLGGTAWNVRGICPRSK